MNLFLIKLWIYFIGVRFYKTLFVPENAETIKSVFKTSGDKEIKFLFFQESYEDIVYKRGKFSTINTHAFILQVKIDEEIQTPALRFNHTRYFFHGTFFPWFKDQDVADALLTIYLKFLEKQLA